MISEKIDLFLDAGQELNFSAVAKKNYTTQPTVSRQISDLEAEWGMQLFIVQTKAYVSRRKVPSCWIVAGR